ASGGRSAKPAQPRREDARRKGIRRGGRLTMERSVEVILADAAALSSAAAQTYVATAKQAVSRNGRFTVALSGGTTPRPVYSLLATDAALRAQAPWSET